MPRITPSLWFDGQAEEAARFYTSIFPNSRVDSVVRAATDVPGTPKGNVLTVEWTLDGQPFIGINGGPEFTFDEAISFTVDCKDQAEVDHYWEALLRGGGEPSVCGWLKDRFGLSWQVIPRQLTEMMASDDHAAAERVTKAMLDMVKIDVAALEKAFNEEPVHA